MKQTSKKIWLTWERQIRNRSMSNIIGAELYELTEDGNRFIKYFKLIPKTLQILAKEKPNQVFAQNPSIVLSFIVVLFKNIFRYTSIIDEHNAGLFPLEGQSRFLQSCAKYIVKRSDWVIVSNAALAELCETWGGNPLVMPDPLPSLQPNASAETTQNKAEKPFAITFICTWSEDEPFDNVLTAAQLLSNRNVILYMTGNPKAKISTSIPENVRLTGFVEYAEYINILQKNDAVMVLTTRENCLNCGAYEAVSLQKPGILSNSDELRRYFHTGFLFTDNSPEDIARRIEDLIDNYDEQTQSIKKLKLKLESEQISNAAIIDSRIKSAQ